MSDEKFKIQSRVYALANSMQQTDNLLSQQFFEDIRWKITQEFQNRVYALANWMEKTDNFFFFSQAVVVLPLWWSIQVQEGGWALLIL